MVRRGGQGSLTKTPPIDRTFWHYALTPRWPRGLDILARRITKPGAPSRVFAGKKSYLVSHQSKENDS